MFCLKTCYQTVRVAARIATTLLCLFASAHVWAAETSNGSSTLRGVWQTSDNGVQRFGLALRASEHDQEYILTSYVQQSAAPIAGEYHKARILRLEKSDKIVWLKRVQSRYRFDDDDPLARTAAGTFEELTLAMGVIGTSEDADLAIMQLDENLFLQEITNWLAGVVTRRLGGGRSSVEFRSGSIVDFSNHADSVAFTTQTTFFVRRHYLPGATRQTREGSLFTISTRHILVKRPGPGYTPRRADRRVGFFDVVQETLSGLNGNRKKRFITRWRLQKKDPLADVSEPIKPITFWIENTTPLALRPHVAAGVLAWNEAFEAAGFRNAIQVDIQPDDAPWDAGDIHYNVIRWAAPPIPGQSLGFGPSVYDPVTGEIIAADILLTHTLLARTLDDWLRLGTSGTATGEPRSVRPNAIADMSNTTATDQARLQLVNAASLQRVIDYHGLRPTARSREDDRKIQSTQNRTEHSEELRPRATGYFDEAPSDPDLVGRLIGEVVTDLVMHEVGHVLGLTHNFRASQWRSLEEIHDRAKTNGLIAASVMDYLPINFAPTGKPQGDFANTRVGPYDKWAIEFGYHAEPDSVATDLRREEILSRATEAHNALHAERFASDPRALKEDLSDSPAAYAAERLILLRNVMEEESNKDAAADPDATESFFWEVQSERAKSVMTLSELLTPFGLGHDNVGGRGHRARQQKVIRLLATHVFAPGVLDYSPALLAELGDGGWAIDDDVARASMQNKDIALSILLGERRLLAMIEAEAAGSDYRAEEYVADLKDAVFGKDLWLHGAPDRGRREQQTLFVVHLVDRISSITANEPGRDLPFGRAVESEIVRVLSPSVSRLKLELMINWPWLSAETRAHRRELRRMLAQIDLG